jgi:hypothetical protein
MHLDYAGKCIRMTGSPERRRAPRRRMGEPPWHIRLSVGGRTCQAIIRDVSVGGVGLVLRTPVAVGAELTVAGKPLLWVAHCTPLDGGTFLVGCRLWRDGPSTDVTA